MFSIPANAMKTMAMTPVISMTTPVPRSGLGTWDYTIYSRSPERRMMARVQPRPEPSP
jgi:hypothetical protein